MKTRQSPQVLEPCCQKREWSPQHPDLRCWLPELREKGSLCAQHHIPSDMSCLGRPRAPEVGRGRQTYVDDI